MSNFLPIVAFFAAMAATLPASAQAQPDLPFHWCTVNAGAGYSAVAGKDGSNLSGQWDFQAGVGATWEKAKTWNWFVNVDYLYSQASVKSGALAEAKILNPTDVGLLSATGGTSRFNVVALDLTVRGSLRLRRLRLVSAASGSNRRIRSGRTPAAGQPFRFSSQLQFRFGRRGRWH